MNGPDEMDPELAEALSTAVADVGYGTVDERANPVSASLVSGADSLSRARSSNVAAGTPTERIEVDETQDCPVSGTVHLRMSGSTTSTTTDETATFSGSLRGGIDYRDCVVQTSEGTVSLTTPSPIQFSLTTQGSYSRASTLVYELDFRMEYEGRFSWALNGGPSGTCVIDIEMVLTEDGVSVSGTCCGRSIETRYSAGA